MIFTKSVLEGTKLKKKQTSLVIKGFIVWKNKSFFCQTQQAIPSG